MRYRRLKILPAAVFVGLLCGTTSAQPAAADPGWPRHYSNGTTDLVVYNPQVEGWKDFKLLWGRCAFALREAAGHNPVYGTFRFEGDTLVDAEQKVVLLRNLRAFDMRFPGAPGETSTAWSGLTRRLLPSSALVVSLDRVLAYVHAGEVPRTEARVLTGPPPIFVSTQPAVLVILDGGPVMLDIANTNLRRVVNTNWDLYQDRSTSYYYLRQDKSWLTAPDLDASFVPAKELPPDFTRVSSDALHVLPADAAPRVIVAHTPSELIVVNGAPQLSPVSGTRLAWVTNTESDLFYHSGSRHYYFLTSGRWFRAAQLSGPWAYASTSLPADFGRIPADHPRSYVLAAVPGTREAEDAVLLAAIPRTAEIQRKEARAEVQYAGSPEFEPIAGTSVAYARNSAADVLRVGGAYYLCSRGAWFVSKTPNGPWLAADSVPPEIYTIPESSPKYNVTYVRVYESTPTAVIYSYTPGYYGAYVSGGVVVWGTGYYYPPYLAVGVGAAPVYWGSPLYTYGAGAWYNPATGVYVRGAAAYGPNGGYGAAAAYNPRTGTYAQGAAAWGPGGGAAAGRTYNPATGTRSAGYSVTNPYGSRGEGVVANGNTWAQGGYAANSRGAVAAGHTSKGGAGVAFEGTGGNSGYLAKSGSGDVYAGANGNVYKRDSGQWYQNQNGSWHAMDKSQISSQRQEAVARDRGTRNAQASERWRAAGANAPQGAWGQQRPAFPGRRR